MAVPHQIFKQLAKKRLVGKEGKEKEREIRKLLVEMPGYKTGPYGEIRKWLQGEIQENRKRGRVKARVFFDVKKEGDAQVVLLGPPNIGKSSLLKKLSSIQIKVADYQFTTLKPIPAMVDFDGALVQVVEIPGLLEGAAEGKGGGRAMLAAARNANYAVLMTSADTPLEKVKAVRDEMRRVDLPTPKFLICNKIDLPGVENIITSLKREFHDIEIVPISVEKNIGIQSLRDAIWRNLELVRINVGGRERPVVLARGAAVRDVLDEIFHDATQPHTIKISGPSAKFSDQQIGLEHVLYDGDALEIH
ncbi:MAG: 50S ribosome-binding GTPase [Candidatus Colwellbacteria bacterium]|nr:50S ribosome-binding GTPase [Candidatus Colwellbacteria bacterium]